MVGQPFFQISNLQLNSPGANFWFKKMVPPRLNSMASMVGSRSMGGRHQGGLPGNPRLIHKMSMFRKKNPPVAAMTYLGICCLTDACVFCVYWPAKMVPNSPCMIFFTQKNKKPVATSSTAMSNTNRESSSILKALNLEPLVNITNSMRSPHTKRSNHPKLSDSFTVSLEHNFCWIKDSSLN